MKATNDGRREVRVLALSASTRTRSLNHRLLTLAVRVAQERGADVDRSTIADFECPFYDADAESATGTPRGAIAFRDRLVMADALLLASPEYNASMPGGIKNLIDWVSRVRPQPFNNKQAFLLSASPSMVGGNRGLWALRVPLEHLGMRVYPDMFSLAQAHEAFDADDELLNAVLQQRLETALGSFLDLVEAAKHYPTVRKQWIEFLGEHPNVATEREETAPVEVD